MSLFVKYAIYENLFQLVTYIAFSVDLHKVKLVFMKLIFMKRDKSNAINFTVMKLNCY